MGLPSIVIIVAKNQKKSVMDLNSLGVLVGLGESQRVTKNRLIESLKEVLVDASLRNGMSNSSLNLMPIINENKVLNILVGNHV